MCYIFLLYLYFPRRLTTMKISIYFNSTNEFCAGLVDFQSQFIIYRILYLNL